jgi:enterobactin synthetase component D
MSFGELASARSNGGVLQALVRGLLPHSGIGVGVRTTADEVAPPLHPLEESYLGPNATPRRRVMFALGRAAARDALAELGTSRDVAIGRGAGGEPTWPLGLVGSISHAGDAAVAAVGRGDMFGGIGVDLERRSPGLSARASRLVCRPAEIEWVDADPGTLRRTLLFSAKEAIFKALYPIEGVWLGFADAELTWEPERHGFRARVLKSVGARYVSGTELRVHCAVTGTEIVSATFVHSPE